MQALKVPRRASTLEVKRMRIQFENLTVLFRKMNMQQK